MSQSIEELTREKDGITEMLGLVLHEVDRPVIVKKELMRQGLGPEYQISIEEDEETDAFVFTLIKKEIV